MREAFFTLFGLFTIACGIGVVLARSAVYSAFSLILAFFGLAAVYVLWGATFIGMIQILIYTGAIVVLFVFVVMLLNLGRGATGHSHTWLTIGISGAAVFALSLLMLRTLNSSLTPGAAPNTPIVTNQMYEVSRLLFNEYLWPFEVLSLFLLALIIAIFAVARPDIDETLPTERIP